MKILFIGGNGNISWYCVQRALEAGHDVYELNRGATLSTRRDIQPQVHKLTGDYRNMEEMQRLLERMSFDVVCNFICFNKEQARFDVELFRDRVAQFIFVSSAAVYERKAQYLPFTESTPKWKETDFDYARDKIEAEEVFEKAYRQNDFPVTIVRPNRTYDTIINVSIGHNCFTAPQMYIDGKPVLIAGDGTNVYTFTHSRDFANAFIGLFGNPKAIGEAFHITTDECRTWLDIMKTLLDLLGVKNPRYIHIPVADILKMNVPASKNLTVSFLGKGFAGDYMWCSMFDNSKIKNVVPGWKALIKYEDGIAETIGWMYEKDVRRRINPALSALLDEITIKYDTK